MNDRVDPETGRIFDVAAHLGTIKTRNGQQPYLAVKHRVLWVRAEHPGARIVVEKVDGGVEAGWVEFRCMVTLPNGAEAVDYGSETRADFPDYFEKAATKATGRALALLGYGTDAAPDLDDGEPLDGRGAAKDERAGRRATAEQRREIEQQHERNIAAQATPITENQLRMIAGTRTKKGVTDVEYRTFLLERFPDARDKDGDPSTRALSVTQASAFIEFLLALPDPVEGKWTEADQQAFEVVGNRDIDHAKKR